MKSYKLALMLLPLSLASCKVGVVFREYNGPKVTYLSFKIENGFSGFGRNNVIDFEANTFVREEIEYYKNCIETPPAEDEDANILRCGSGRPSVDTFEQTFTEEAEKALIDGIYSSKLFFIKDKYWNENVCDGTEWTLFIRFQDGTSKTSIGYMDCPEKVFENCSKYFMDFCGYGVMFNYDYIAE